MLIPIQEREKGKANVYIISHIVIVWFSQAKQWAQTLLLHVEYKYDVQYTLVSNSFGINLLNRSIKLKENRIEKYIDTSNL